MLAQSILAQPILAQSGWLHPAAIFWIAIAAICIVPSIAYYWSLVKKAELDASLKQTMLDRGMSADEIERVLRAKGKEG